MKIIWHSNALAGDHLKKTSNLGEPIVGINLSIRKDVFVTSSTQAVSRWIVLPATQIQASPYPAGAQSRRMDYDWMQNLLVLG
jgi:hypothetical protein